MLAYIDGDLNLAIAYNGNGVLFHEKTFGNGVVELVVLAVSTELFGVEASRLSDFGSVSN